MRHHLSAAALTLLAALPAFGQEAVDRHLSLELNRIDAIEGACRLTFMVDNALGVDLDALALETVLIDRAGVVERLTLFEFGALPGGSLRVRQFDVPGLSCDALGRVLINGVAECGGAAPCAAALRLGTRTDVEVIG
jgi:hypothetical protein